MPTYNYLLGPNFQAEDESGKPLVGGYVEVYLHNTTTKYVTKKDFNGTNNEFRVVLNSLGMAVIIADVANAYDVYCYDRFGSLKWSRMAVNCTDTTVIANNVPLVRAKFQNGAWSKISGDDGFIKNNPYGIPSLYLPSYGWWCFNTSLSVHNPTPRDLIQHLQLKWTRYAFIEEGVPPAFYDEPNLPGLTYEADFTRPNTNNHSGTSLYKEDTNTNHWFGVSLTAYNDTLPNDLEYAIWVELFKVRDA